MEDMEPLSKGAKSIPFGDTADSEASCLNLCFEGKAGDHLKLQELRACVELELKKQALRLAQHFLEKPRLDGEQFLAAVDVIEAFAGKTAKWAYLIEQA